MLIVLIILLIWSGIFWKNVEDTECSKFVVVVAGILKSKLWRNEFVSPSSTVICAVGYFYDWLQATQIKVASCK